MKSAQGLVLILLGVLVFMQVLVTLETRNLRLDLKQAIKQEEPIMNEKPGEKVFKWVDADCHDREVVTTKGPTESQDEFCARHNTAVAHDLQEYGVKEQMTIIDPKTQESQTIEHGLNRERWLLNYLKNHPEEVIESPFWH